MGILRDRKAFCVFLLPGLLFYILAVFYPIEESIRLSFMEVAFVGFDDINQSAKCNPPLTTIHTPKEQLGIAAANCLLTRIRAPKTPCVFSQYSTELIIRESTDI